jgi:hypothetical protein
MARLKFKRMPQFIDAIIPSLETVIAKPNEILGKSDLIKVERVWELAGGDFLLRDEVTAEATREVAAEIERVASATPATEALVCPIAGAQKHHCACFVCGLY